MTPRLLHESKGTSRSRVVEMYLKVQAGQGVHKGPRLVKGTFRSKVGITDLKVQAGQRVTECVRLAKGT